MTIEMNTADENSAPIQMNSGDDLRAVVYQVRTARPDTEAETLFRVLRPSVQGMTREDFDQALEAGPLGGQPEFEKALAAFALAAETLSAAWSELECDGNHPATNLGAYPFAADFQEVDRAIGDWAAASLGRRSDIQYVLRAEEGQA